MKNSKLERKKKKKFLSAGIGKQISGLRSDAATKDKKKLGGLKNKVKVLRDMEMIPEHGKLKVFQKKG